MIEVLLLKLGCFSLPIVTITPKQNMVIHTQLNSSVWKFNGLHIGIVSASAGTGLLYILLRYYRIRQNIRRGKLSRFSRILAKRESFTIESFPSSQLENFIIIP